MNDDQLTKTRAACLRLLTRREHSQAELLSKLSVKGHDLDDIQIIITEMIAEGWQSDQRFRRAFIRQRIAKGFGPIRIEYELKQRGLELNWADLDDDDHPNWLNVIEMVYRKKYSANDCLLTGADWGKRSRFLQQRGFSGAIIKALFNELGLKLA